MTRRLGQFDQITGEILEDGFVAYVAPKRRNGFSQQGWLAMGQNAALMFAQRRDELGKEGFAVLMGALAKLDFENLLLLNQAELARELGMQRQNVQKGLKRLIAMGAILEGPRIGVSRAYRLNPEFGWKGSARGHVKALDSLRQQRMKDARITGVIQGGGQAAEPADTFTRDLFEGA